MKAIIMIGIQASGKSSFCRSILPDSFVRINLDELNTRNKEKRLLSDCIAKEKNIVIDNTNPTKEDRERYIPVLKENGYAVTGYFMQSRVKDCISRNEERQGKARVPVAAIAATSNKMELPEYSEGFDRLFFVKLYHDEFVIDEWEEKDEI